jgi:hypothetical protein
VLAATVAQPGSRGCAFANAVAESELDSGAVDPAGLARQLTLPYDGALAPSRLDPTQAAAEAAKAAANALVDTALRAGRR